MQDELHALRHADASIFGLTRSALRGRRWTHPADGLAVPRDDADDLYRLCRGLHLVLPLDAVFTHITAAALRRWWLPQLLRPVPVVACTDADAAHLERRGVYIRRCAMPQEHRSTLAELQVASPERTVVELAEHLSLIDLVVLIDGALASRELSIDRLRAAVVPRRRGVVRLRRAIQLADGRSESPWESVLRLLHVLAGITEVEPQYRIYAPDGTFIARADLRIGNSRRATEYDGAGHRDKLQHRHDLQREKALTRSGWERYGYTAIEICRGPGQIIADAEDAAGLDHDPQRVHDWLVEFAACSLSDAGRRALDRRLARFVRTTPPRRR